MQPRLARPRAGSPRGARPSARSPASAAAARPRSAAASGSQSGPGARRRLSSASPQSTLSAVSRLSGASAAEAGSFRSEASDTPDVSAPLTSSRRESLSGSGDSRVRVAVRVRPVVRATGEAGEAVHCSGNRLWVVDGAGDSGSPAGRGERHGTGSPRQFVVDWALPPSTTQAEVYEHVCGETGLVEGVLRGVHGCVMCYGQTGSGKTHTLSSTVPGNEGIVPRALRNLFDAARNSDSELHLSYVQVYLDSISDLLKPGSNVELREIPGEGVVLTGAASERVTCIEDALSRIEAANRNRVIGATAMNASSSRSHTILVVQASTRDGPRTLRARLLLVDLAGSERVRRSAVTGAALEEACAINSSLECLGRCVAILAAPKGKGGRPPFRECKLTRLLSPALSGGARTALVVCVAPSTADAAETLASLSFGQQAMSVKVRAKVNATVDVRALASELASKLRDERASRMRVEAAVWAKLKPLYDAQASYRATLSAEAEAVVQLRSRVAAAEGAARGGEAAAVASRRAAADRARAAAHARKAKALKQQLAAAQREVARLREKAEAATVRGGDDTMLPAVAARAARRLESGAKMISTTGAAGRHNDEPPPPADSLESKVDAYAQAARNAWAQVQRVEETRDAASGRLTVANDEAERLEVERESMEDTLHNVADGLSELAVIYRGDGRAEHAVPLYMATLAIYEKTLGAAHPEVGKDLVNLGNAYCDMGKYGEAIPLYMRALAIDQAALGDDHPEVAMDLSNLGFVYRIQGRREEAIALLQRAHGIMLTTLGPDNPKTQMIADNLAETQNLAIEVTEPALSESTPSSSSAGIEEEVDIVQGCTRVASEKSTASAIDQHATGVNVVTSGLTRKPLCTAPTRASASVSDACVTPRSSYANNLRHAKAVEAEAIAVQGAAQHLLQEHIRAMTITHEPT